MKHMNNARLFFLEICIATAFFIMIAVTCFLCFTKARLVQNNANRQIEYNSMIENASEIFFSSDSVQDAITNYTHEISDAKIDKNCISYTENGMKLNIELSSDQTMMHSIITIKSQDEPLYQISLDKALGEMK